MQETEHAEKKIQERRTPKGGASMSHLRLTLGRAGSGKTRMIYEEILAEVERDPVGAPLWLITPEQATLQAEQELSALSPHGGFMRLRVVSFKRLAHMVFQAVSGAALQPISEVGKQMLVRTIVEERRQDLRLFSRAASQPGFCRKIMELLSELRSYRVRPVHLKAALDASTSLGLSLSNKVSDLAIIYEALSERYEQLGIEDSDETLDRLEEHVRDYKDIKGARIWLDGFTGFTPQEYAVLGRIMAVAQELTVTLTMEPGLLETVLTDEHHFYIPWETAHKLMADAHSLGMSKAKMLTVADGVRFSHSPALRYLEQSYFNRSAKPYEGRPEGLLLVGAANRRAEVEAAAREILRLCRTEGLRFRDLCVVVRDIESYADLLETVFTDHDIPFFLDRKRPVPHHPLVDLLRAVLEAVEKGYAYEPMLRALKTDLFPLSRDEVDLLDNCVLAYGVRGNRWFADKGWDYAGSEFEEHTETIEGARRTVVKLFEPLAAALQSGKAGVSGHGLREFLQKLEVEQTLFRWAQEAEEEGNLEEGRLHAQVYQAVIELLNELIASLGSEEMELATFLHIASTGLEGIALGLIPPGLDQVVVTILGRSRSPSVRAALVLGANEGVFPARARSEGILSDEDRRLLANLNVGIGPSVRSQLFEEDYLIYTAFSRASRHLWVSYAQAKEDGSALPPSMVVKRLRELFPLLEEKFCPLEPPEDTEGVLEYLAHPGSAAGMLAAKMSGREAQPLPGIWRSVQQYLKDREATKHLVDRIEDGLKYRNAESPLPGHVVRRMYGTTLRGSVSRLERFRGCPFSYYAAYGLRLRERKVYKLAAPDLGNFFHEALDRFANRLQEQKRDWGNLSEQEHRSLAAEITRELAPALQSEILSSTARYRHLTRRLQQTLERSARVLGSHFRRGKFRPLGVEVGFGPGETTPALRIDLPDGLSLSLAGRIDRLDGAEAQEKLYIRVVDYKSGSSKLTPLEVYYGIKVQLLLYLKVAVDLARSLLGRTEDQSQVEVMPAGALYFRVHDPLVRSIRPLDDEEVEEQLQKDFRPGGFVVAENEVIELMEEGLKGSSTVMPIRLKKDGTVSKSDYAWSREQYEALTAHLEHLLAEAGDEIARGKVEIAPYRLDKKIPCTYCPYLSVCKFDLRLPENRYRSWDKIPSAEVWQRLGVLGGEEHVEVD
jgi:ATP-dependent helicase/nuclease subunit B